MAISSSWKIQGVSHFFGEGLLAVVNSLDSEQTIVRAVSLGPQNLAWPGVHLIAVSQLKVYIMALYCVAQTWP